jgi:hypothetical protein
MSISISGVSKVTGGHHPVQVSDDGRVVTEPLGSPAVARQLTAGAASANQALTATTRRISIRCRNADSRFAIGTGTQTANGETSHFIALDERLDFAVPPGAQIAVIRDTLSGSNGVIELTELA